MNTRIFLVTLTLGLAAIGCAKDKPAETPATPVADGSGQGNESQRGAPEGGQLVIDPAIAKLCNIPTAYFAFDSASLGQDGKAALDAVASCFTTGPAKDKSMAIVGHADPRGETQYNFGLGQRRAGSVEGHLTKRGVPETRIETSSRGELEASGTDESTWAKDRKVEILLAN